MEEAYAIASRCSPAAGEKNKAHYDVKAKSIIYSLTIESLALRNTSIDLQLPKKTATNGQKCFSYRGINLWNCLPNKAKIRHSFLFVFLFTL